MQPQPSKQSQGETQNSEMTPASSRQSCWNAAFIGSRRAGAAGPRVFDLVLSARFSDFGGSGSEVRALGCMRPL